MYSWGKLWTFRNKKKERKKWKEKKEKHISDDDVDGNDEGKIFYTSQRKFKRDLILRENERNNFYFQLVWEKCGKLNEARQTKLKL